MANPKTIIEGTEVPVVKYDITSLRDVKLEVAEKGSNTKQEFSRLCIGEKVLEPTKRFMTSMAALYGFSENIFNLFTPTEVIERIIDKGKGDNLRIASVEMDDGSLVASAATNPNKAFVRSEDLFFELMEQGIDQSQISYHDGVIRSMHIPSRLGIMKHQIGGDDLVHRFVVDTPIDGWGNPSAYLSMLREVCSNGMIGYAKAFKSVIKLGSGSSSANFDAIPTIRRFLDAFNNEDGFVQLKRRLEAASTSPASLDEFAMLWKMITGPSFESIHRDANRDDPTGIIKSTISTRLRDLSGDAQNIYSLVNLDALAPKQRTRIPVQCSILSLLNFASEIATHHADSHQSRRLSAWIGQMVSEPGFDLEGTLMEGEEHVDLFVTDSSVAHKDDDAKEIN